MALFGQNKGLPYWYEDADKITIISPSARYIRIGDAGVTNYSLDSNDDLMVSGELEVKSTGFFGGFVYFDGTCIFRATPKTNDNIGYTFGTGDDATIEWNTVQTPDTLIAGLGTDSNGFVICEKADKGFDFAHAQQTHPTLFIQSKNQTTTEWIGFSHDGTNGKITLGTANGTLVLPVTFTGTGDVAVNGYITIKDSAGAAVKLATVA